jgi:hypothetical protein
MDLVRSGLASRPVGEVASTDDKRPRAAGTAGGMAQQERDLMDDSQATTPAHSTTPGRLS